MATSLPTTDRFRVGAPSPSGMRLVTDRDRSESFWVYPMLTPLQQAMGHEAGRWYFKPLSHAGNGPASIAYPSFEAAIRGLQDSQAFKDSFR